MSTYKTTVAIAMAYACADGELNINSMVDVNYLNRFYLPDVDTSH